jgi:hypothetical protein
VSYVLSDKDRYEFSGIVTAPHVNLTAHGCTKVTGTNEGGRVLDRSVHLKSRAIVSQSASVTCCERCLPLRPASLRMCRSL